MSASRAKGIAFERVVASAFEGAGFHVRGLESGGDHLVLGFGDGVLHVEAKRQERLQLPIWLRQQERDCPPGARRVVVFKQSRQTIYAVEPFAQFVEREARLAVLGGAA